MSKMSKACDISPKVKKAVYERDNGLCIICGAQGLPNAHYIPRSKGGLGIEQNIVTLCPQCHHDYDNGGKRKDYGTMIKAYLKFRYDDWDEEKLYYNKYDWIKQ